MTIKTPYLLFLVVICLWACKTSSDNFQPLSKTETEKARVLFVWQCSRCHGMEGNGGNGPSLRRQQLTYATDREALHRIIRSGIPGTEMPGTWMMSDSEIELVGRYVRSLGQVIIAGEVKGNPENGKMLYEQKGNCRSCHVINGKGTAIGPVLSGIGARRSPVFLRNALTNPGTKKASEEVSISSDGFEDYLMVSVATKDGQAFRGFRINEDAFSIQLKNAGNEVRSFKKGELVSLEKEFGESMMPSFKSVFTESELDDLVAYLFSLKGK